MTLEEFQKYVFSCRNQYDKSKVQPKIKIILAENINNANLTKIYSSINAFAKAIKGALRASRFAEVLLDNISINHQVIAMLKKKNFIAINGD